MNCRLIHCRALKDCVSDATNMLIYTRCLVMPLIANYASVAFIVLCSVLDRTYFLEHQSSFGWLLVPTCVDFRFSQTLANHQAMSCVAALWSVCLFTTRAEKKNKIKSEERMHRDRQLTHRYVLLLARYCTAYSSRVFIMSPPLTYLQKWWQVL